jgi:hypothetical protein
MRAQWMVMVGVALLVGCANDGTKSEVGKRRAALESEGARVVSFGDKASELGFAPAAAERAAHGTPAVARLATGETLVLDALHSRVVRLELDGSITEVATVDRDADDLAVAPDGAFAVKRGSTPKVVVYSARGARMGELSFGILQNVERIELGASRRVTAISAHQERYLLGSPTFPASEAEVLHSKREGVASRADGAGLSVLRSSNGEISLVSSRKGSDDERSVEVARAYVAEGASARIVGVTGDVACMRVEHLAKSDEIAVDREAVCVDAVLGTVVFRTPLGAPGLFVPHRELSFEHGVLTFAKPEASSGGKSGGLRIVSYVVGEKKQ